MAKATGIHTASVSVDATGTSATVASAASPVPGAVIPEELLEQFERGNVLLFIGDSVTRDPDGVVVAEQIAYDLAARAGLTHNGEGEEISFPEAAQAYQDAMGRQALIQFVRDRIEALGDEPQQVHLLIAGLMPCKAFASTLLDRRLERAFEAIGRPLDVIIDDTDVPFEDERNAQLYKLRGSLERPESLVLTEDDYDEFSDDQASISLVLQALLARKTIVFAGYDLADANFRRLHRKVTAELDGFGRRSYAFTMTASATVTRWCQRRGIELIRINPATFLQELSEQLASRGRSAEPAAQVSVQTVPAPAAVPLPDRPYKLLDYYRTEDAAIFFGRDQETRTLSSLIHAHRLVVLYGASGTGKTSLVLAGVVPRLQNADPPYDTLHARVRGEDNPSVTIQAALAARLGKDSMPAPGSGRLVDALDSATKAAGKPLVIFLDQFEEFFIQCGPQVRQAFIAELGEVYDAREVRVKVVLSLREDWLASINEFRQRIPEVFNVDFRLLPLTRDAARQAIVAPAEQLGLTYEPALIERLLSDLLAQEPAALAAEASTPVASAPANELGGVMPPQLQLVCDALYESMRANGRKRVLLSDYEAVGGVQGVLTGYIERALRQHPAGERDLARQVLISLVSSRNMRSSADVKSIAAAVGAGEPVVQELLDRLADQRLVRRIEDSGAYELAHDVLAASISAWIGEGERQLKQVRELLKREVADWQQDAGLLLSESKFRRVNAVRDDLRTTGEENVFLARAAVTYGEEAAYWLERLPDAASRSELLLKLLDSAEPSARLHAAEQLAAYPGDEAANALADSAIEDSDDGVREAAALSLGRMDNATGLRHLLETGLLDQGMQRTRAVHALALAEDAVPGVVLPAAGPLRRRVLGEVLKLRLARGWPNVRRITVAGAVGGASGFAVGVVPAIFVHMAAIATDQEPAILMFVLIVFALSGLLYGAGLAFGLGAAAAVANPGSARFARVWGAVVLGALSAGVALFLWTLLVGDKILVTSAGGVFFGVIQALGLTLPGLLGGHRRLALLGAAVGGAMGLVVFGAFGFDPFLVGPKPTVPLPILLAAGAMQGAILALAITRAEGSIALADGQVAA